MNKRDQWEHTTTLWLNLLSKYLATIILLSILWVFCFLSVVYFLAFSFPSNDTKNKLEIFYVFGTYSVLPSPIGCQFTFLVDCRSFSGIFNPLKLPAESITRVLDPPDVAN